MNIEDNDPKHVFTIYLKIITEETTINLRISQPASV